MNSEEQFADEDAREQDRMLRELDDDELISHTRNKKRKHPPNSALDSEDSDVTNSSCESDNFPLAESSKPISMRFKKISSSRGKGRPSKLIKLISANKITELDRYKDRYCVCCLLELEDVDMLSLQEIEKNLLSKRKDSHHFCDHWRRHGFDHCKKTKKWTVKKMLSGKLSKKNAQIKKNLSFLKTFHCRTTDENLYGQLKTFSETEFTEFANSFLAADDSEKKTILQKFLTSNSENQNEPTICADTEHLEPPNRKYKNRYCVACLLEESFDLETCTLEE